MGRTAQGGSAESFERIARLWHEERYEELENGGAERSNEVLRDLELHVIPAFGDLLACSLDEGRQRVKDWLRTMSGRNPKDSQSRFTPAARPYARGTVNNLLWMLREVLGHARALGYDVPGYAEGKSIKAMDPLGRKKEPAPIVSLSDAARIARHLHVIHQLVLWLLRIVGLRISEAYGIQVGSFVVDEDGAGFLTVAAQGGRAFRIRDDDGVRVAHRKTTVKTASGYRLVALPAQLTSLIGVVIAAFHARPDGTIDVSARLVPPIRSKQGGQAGFRSALAAAARAVGLSEAVDDYVVPHDLRKNLSTDLAWSDDISGLLARRVMGHRAGSDVFDAVYTLDSRLKKHLGPAARTLEIEIAAAIPNLMVPTTMRPAYGAALPDDQRRRVDSELEAAGWQVRDRGESLRTAEVARHLDMAMSSVRRLLERGVIPAAKCDGEWRVAVDDVSDFRERLAGYRLLPIVAEDAGVDYHTAYRTLRSLEIDAGRDALSRMLLLTDAEAKRVVGEIERVRALRDRSMTLAAAAARLAVAESTCRAWARSGRLVADVETDAAGRLYVLRVSVETELAGRTSHRSRSTVGIGDFQAATGFDDAGVRALVRAKLLVRARKRAFTTSSVRRYVTAYRPELLDSPRLGLDRQPL